MITGSKANRNAGIGIDLTNKWGIISAVQAKKNATGVAMECRGNTASLTAQKNPTANLVQTINDAPCANVNLNAP